jgi:Tol biopolymer transport system component
MDRHILAPTFGVLVLLGPAGALPQGCPTTELVGNVPVEHHGAVPSLTPDGRYVAFVTSIPFAPGDVGWQDVYVADRYTGSFEQVSVSSGGGQGDGHSFQTAISPDGNCVIFRSAATNLVAGDTNGKMDVFVHDRTTGVTERVTSTAAAPRPMTTPRTTRPSPTTVVTPCSPRTRPTWSRTT